ncbi:hypothetical protein DKL61_10300 [Gammaproteobacteria bacterium ESL0073]|nr:hypothetical protein DKL61_10300 [Gammaproteobacteria bacterium ESL0073]
MSLKVWVEKLINGQESPLPVPKNYLMLNGIYIDDAVRSHVEWRNNWFNALRAHKSDTYEVEKVSADNLCKVGQWIYGPGKEYEGMAEYEALKQKHAAFHCCAGEVVKLHNNGLFMDSMMITKGELQDTSLKVGVGLVDLLEAVQKTLD